MSNPKIQTPDNQTILAAIKASGPGARAANVRIAIFPETAEFHHTKHNDQHRATDRGLQSVRKAGLATYDSKKGWALTAAGKKAVASCA